MSATTPDAGPTVVTVVHAPACHFCDDAKQALAELAAQFGFNVELVAADDPAGIALMASHRAPMYPLILLDSEFFSFGRLPRKKLRKRLEDRAALVA
jgi:thiol-disulfide isomerase/thioredoxin